MPDRNDHLFDIDDQGNEVSRVPAGEPPTDDAALPELSPEPPGVEAAAGESSAPDLASEIGIESGAPAPAAPLPVGRLIFIGVALALAAGIVFDTLKLREARLAVEKAGAELTAARGDLARETGALAAARAETDALRAAGARDGCDKLAGFIDGDGLRMLPLHGEGRGKGARAQLYLPPGGEGCLVATGSLPAGPLALWQVTGASAKRLGRLRDAGGAKLAAATLAAPKGKLVVAPDPDPSSLLPGGEALLIGAVE